jgi:hypothetical protein
VSWCVSGWWYRLVEWCSSCFGWFWATRTTFVILRRLLSKLAVLIQFYSAEILSWFHYIFCFALCQATLLLRCLLWAHHLKYCRFTFFFYTLNEQIKTGQPLARLDRSHVVDVYIYLLSSGPWCVHFSFLFFIINFLQYCIKNEIIASQTLSVPEKRILLFFYFKSDQPVTSRS